METKFNFKSAICTDKNQSGRLLALGLKKETADIRGVEGIEHTPTFAWSLHRLIDLCPISIRHMGYHYSLIYDIHRDWVVYMLYANGNNKPYNQHLRGFQNCNRYDAFIDCIEWLIKEGYFNKEYLEE